MATAVKIRGASTEWGSLIHIITGEHFAEGVALCGRRAKMWVPPEPDAKSCHPCRVVLRDPHAELMSP